ncbi:MAG TPA: hypothetical protein VNX70_08440, partial [Bryobacteraceae bacterium]|nr:hypothetical protein [Bryobacteraceae bacterium]
MKQFWFVLIFGAAMLVPALSQKHASDPFAGRWDLTITAGNTSYPSWMELVDEGGNPAVRIVGRTGSARSVQDVKAEGVHLSFTTTESFGGKPIKVTWAVNVQGDELTGKQHRADGIDYELAGVRAPSLKRPVPTAWTKPEPLFDGKDL